MIVIEKLVKYNANSKDNDTGDCVKRSLSLAYNIDYDQVKRELNKIRRDIGAPYWNIPKVFEKFMSDHGMISKDTISSDCKDTVNDFCDSHPSGTYIIMCTGNRRNSTHLVTVIDGDIYDSWDSGDRRLLRVYTVSGDRSTMNNLSSEDLKNMAKEAVSQISSQIDGYNTDIVYTIDDYIEYSSGGFNIYVTFSFDKYDYDSLDDIEDKIIFKFSPRNTVDQNNAIMSKIIKNNIRHYMKYIAHILQQAEEYKDLHSQYDDKFTSYDRTLLNKLPFWCRKLVISTYTDNRRNRYFGDKYEVIMQALPDDYRRDDAPEVTFVGDTLSELISNIEEYKKNYSRFGYDY